MIGNRPPARRLTRPAALLAAGVLALGCAAGCSRGSTAPTVASPQQGDDQTQPGGKAKAEPKRNPRMPR